MALVLFGSALPAQGDTATRRAQRAQGQLPPRGGARAGRGAVTREAPQKDLTPRQAVQQAFRTRVREVLSLDQAKTRRLFQTDQDFNRQRSALNQSERQARVALAAAMDSGAVDQSKIDQYINQLVQAPRKRADLLEAEQKELSTFLTPLQRAQFLSLRERLNERMRQLNQADAAGRRGQPPTPPPL
jgi:Spy/CpxP family protein refolding chaperone